MKILLISSPKIPPNNAFTKIYWCEASSQVGSILPPLDLLYLASILRKQGNEVRVIDYKETFKIPTNLEFDVLIMHITNQTLELDLKILRAFKRLNSKCKTIVFGCHPTINPEFYLKIPEINHVLKGEPEKEFMHYQDLDKLPIPAYDLVDLDDYTCPHIKKKPFVVALSSRGCSFDCLFCSSRLMFGRGFRPHSAKRVVDEMEYYEKKLGVKEIFYYDDCFTLDKQRVFDVCKFKKERGLKVIWKCDTRADLLWKPMLVDMLDAGCYQLSIGVESGNQNILNGIRKGLRLENIRQTFKNCRDVGMETIAFFMLGLPNETKQTLQDSIDFAKEIDPTYVQFTIATPYIGTDFYNLALKEGWIEEGKEMDCASSCAINTKDLTAKDVEDALKKAYRSFYLRPKKIIKNITKVKNGFRLIK